VRHFELVATGQRTRRRAIDMRNSFRSKRCRPTAGLKRVALIRNETPRHVKAKTIHINPQHVLSLIALTKINADIGAALQKFSETTAGPEHEDPFASLVARLLSDRHGFAFGGGEGVGLVCRAISED